MSGFNNLKNWLQHHYKNEGVEGRKEQRQNYTVLLRGDRNTMLYAAEDLAKHTGKELHRVDLSQLVSKYIGETEKNIHRLFQQAESKNGILFLEESDALPGKRTNIQDAHDRYANRRTKLALSRLRQYPGLLLIANR